MSLLCATVFLLLAASSVLAETPNNECGNAGPSYNPVPACSADYKKMSVEKRKVFQKRYHPHSLCVRKDGHFVATAWSNPKATFTYMFDACGWVEKKIDIPNGGVSQGGSCAFSNTKLFYADTHDGKILQFSKDGKYEDIFTTGKRFLRQIVMGNLLYTTVLRSKKIYAYDLNTKKIVHEFQTTNGNARGLAFDPTGSLHVTTWSSFVEIFNAQGVKQRELNYPQVGFGDGILIDSNHYTILADRKSFNVFVFTETKAVHKKISGFGDPSDIGMGLQCGYLLVADYERGGIFLL